ncbi:hypothetical protein [Microbacterium sp. VKM Ac-2923]|uniref:hypothetical protein n=1 Tax=Microbacterium sp. VKM Ac-2923 TaxID=2929476 RepID=UPI001FB5091E|nr:hypothetical protein [Microbacterium sp. VKM Ac-2923]MCJ1708711.1 hypothetical protein [Microbacterium sp. VKM Ac-2923]
MYSSASGATVLVFSILILLITLLVLYFLIRSAVTEGMKNYQLWRERSGRDVPPADPSTPTTRR